MIDQNTVKTRLLGRLAELSGRQGRIEPIGDGRLSALPTATRCLDCAEQ